MLARTGEGRETDTALYSAFISYSHHDRAAATSLQRRIERYRLPRHLRRKGAPARLKPVFRDRDELSAAPDLTEAVRAALRQSEHLIVVCTPHAAASAWVGREIEYFREIGGGGVLTALFDGETGQAMHRALMSGEDGAPAHPLAADFRRGGDGRLALLKLIAPMAGVRLDELVQRDAQRRVRQVAMLAVAAIVLVVGAAALILAAARARAVAEQEQARGADAMQFQLTDLRRKLETAGRLDLLAAVNSGVAQYCREKGEGTSVPTLLQCAAGLQADAKDAELRDDFRIARQRAIDAWRLTAPLAEAYPRDGDVLYAHAQSEYYMGFADWRLGDVRNARLRFERYAALAARLTSLAPRSADWLAERAYAASNLGMVTLRGAVDTDGARRYFESAQAGFRRVAQLKPDDSDIQTDLADGEAWLADVERVAGNLPAALAHRLRQRAIISALVAASPRDASLRVKLVASDLGLARVEAAQGQQAAAITRLDTAHRDAVALAAADPENKVIARQRRGIEVFTARTWLTMPAASRPPIDTIAAKLGNCDTDWRQPRNEELAALCTLELARLHLARGDGSSARATLDRAGAAAIVQAPFLTERWRLDLRQSYRVLRDELRRQPVA